MFRKYSGNYGIETFTIGMCLDTITIRHKVCIMLGILILLTLQKELRIA